MAITSTFVSGRIPAASTQNLDDSDKMTERLRSYLATDAIEENAPLHEWQIRAIQEGLDDIAKGNIISFEEVKKKWAYA